MSYKALNCIKFVFTSNQGQSVHSYAKIDKRVICYCAEKMKQKHTDPFYPFDKILANLKIVSNVIFCFSLLIWYTPLILKLITFLFLPFKYYFWSKHLGIVDE